MPARRFYVIVNPAASRGHALGAWEPARRVLDAASAEYEVALTERPRHATELAERAARDGWSAVVAVGGDGTVHEVANGLLRASAGETTRPLGIIGVGTGNDFIKRLGLPRRHPAKAAARLLHAEPRQVDAGRLDEEYFTNGVGVGFDARVAIEARRVRGLRGMAVYAAALVRVLRHHRTPRMRLHLDGRLIVDRPLTLITVANGPCHGGGFWLCPDARLNDGALDLCVADALTPAQLLPLVPRVMRGTHVTRPDVQMLRGHSVHISSDEPLPVHADGEIYSEAAHELKLEVLPGRLTVLV